MFTKLSTCAIYFHFEVIYAHALKTGKHVVKMSTLQIVDSSKSLVESWFSPSKQEKGDPKSVKQTKKKYVYCFNLH